MGISSFKKILKGLDKTADFAGNAATFAGRGVKSATKGAKFIANDAIVSGVGLGKTGLDVARYVKKHGFYELSDEALENSTNLLEHLTGVRAKKSTNALAFGAIASFGALEIYGDAEKKASMGDIVGADTVPNMINQDTSPITQAMVDRYNEDSKYSSRVDEHFSDKYGSAGPDLVFALHELRNRG